MKCGLPQNQVTAALVRELVAFMRDITRQVAAEAEEPTKLGVACSISCKLEIREGHNKEQIRAGAREGRILD
jgi:hypothetical protein